MIISKVISTIKNNEFSVAVLNIVYFYIGIPRIDVYVQVYVEIECVKEWFLILRCGYGIM